MSLAYFSIQWKSCCFFLCILAILTLLNLYFNGPCRPIQDRPILNPLVAGNEALALGSDDVNFPYISETALTLPMQSFTEEHEFKIEQGPKQRLTSETKSLFLNAVNAVSLKFNFSRSSFEYGSYRILRNGVEFNLLFEKSKRRITAFQPFSSSIHSKEISTSYRQKVHIIMPLKGKLSSLSSFLDNMVNRILPSEKNIALTVVYFNDELAAGAKELIRKKLKTSPHFKWHFVLAEDAHFSRGKAIRIGVESSAKEPSDLVFICDVDVLVKPEFFRRCRANSVLEKQVYFPVLYSLYNPALVYGLYDKAAPDIPDQLIVTGDNGFFRYFGFGMFCMHRKEYDAVGGVPEYSTWGKEDIDFYERFAQAPFIKVIRALDTTIFHMFHKKDCRTVRTDLYSSCLGSKAASEGTKIQVGMLYFKTHEGIDVEGILSKRFAYFWMVPILAALNVFQLCVIIYQKFISPQWASTEMK